MPNKEDDGRWLHSDTDLISGHGVTYYVHYLGSVEVLCSMKTLDFENRTRVARESIRTVCNAVGVALKDRRKIDNTTSNGAMISAEPNLTYSGTPAELTISTEALSLKRSADKHVLFSHKMEGISFASAGEHDTKDYIAYVAKDSMSRRSCHVLSCKENESLDVITTVGQAFELRYNEYIQTQQISDQGPAESFKFSELEDNVNRYPAKPTNQQSTSTNKWSPSTTTTMTTTTASMTTGPGDVYKERWFHGKIGRDEAELLLHNSGDFLVRESAKIPGQFILSGRYKDQFKHLLLVDPEGVIRTKDYEFDSIQHLVSYHRSGNIPIVSADSELLLQAPILRSK